MATKYAGVDISYCQPIVDYEALAKGTINGYKIKFVLIRAAYGLKEDNYFKKHVDGCLKAGLKVGIYHYSTAKTPTGAKNEANFLISLIKKYGYDGKISYPICYDLEESYQSALGQATCTAMCKAYCDTIKSYNYYPMIYTNFDWLFWSKKINYDALKEYPFWVAGYISESKAAPYLSKITVWQYSVAGNSEFDIAKIKKVPGINGECDCNWAYVGLAAKIKKLGMNKFPTVNYKITATKPAVPENEVAKYETTLKNMGFTVVKVKEK